MIDSVIWDDLYKVTMGQPIFNNYSAAVAHYTFINRGNTEFPVGFAEELKRLIKNISHRTMTNEEHEFLLTIGSPRPLLSAAYIDWLMNYQYNPDEITIQQDGGKLKIDIRGPWYRTIRWEVKLMAMIVALYNELMNHNPKDGWLDSAAEKGRLLKANGIKFSDFGTRRAFSPLVHENVLKTLIHSAGPCLLGTSNLYLAMKYGLKPIGTKAHEWFMGHACMYGYRDATDVSLRIWSEEFDGDLGIALTDTFTTDVFLRDFGVFFAKLYDGVRHDSGCPLKFADKIIEHYEKLGIDPMSKTIVFSDALDVNKTIEISDYCWPRIKTVFGIGTHLTNDVGHPSLNIVIKLKSLTLHSNTTTQIVPAVKLSDDADKACGDKAAIEHARYELGL